MCRYFFFLVTSKKANPKPTILWDADFSCNAQKYFEKTLPSLSHQVKLFQTIFIILKMFLVNLLMAGKSLARSTIMSLCN